MEAAQQNHQLISGKANNTNGSQSHHSPVVKCAPQSMSSAEEHINASDRAITLRRIFAQSFPAFGPFHNIFLSSIWHYLYLSVQAGATTLIKVSLIMAVWWTEEHRRSLRMRAYPMVGKSLAREVRHQNKEFWRHDLFFTANRHRCLLGTEKYRVAPALLKSN